MTFIHQACSCISLRHIYTAHAYKSLVPYIGCVAYYGYQHYYSNPTASWALKDIESPPLVFVVVGYAVLATASIPGLVGVIYGRLDQLKLYKNISWFQLFVWIVLGAIFFNPSRLSTDCRDEFAVKLSELANKAKIVTELSAELASLRDLASRSNLTNVVDIVSAADHIDAELIGLADAIDCATTACNPQTHDIAEICRKQVINSEIIFAFITLVEFYWCLLLSRYVRQVGAEGGGLLRKISSGSRREVWKQETPNQLDIRDYRLGRNLKISAHKLQDSGHASTKFTAARVHFGTVFWPEVATAASNI
ncbi:hypothetical protein BDV93DRAFT_610172 [Ceratobasidium sp. AG-I]|nr:hypothetical protein BDV93DRAFT_610172 [Ceratobasidium sp. AG-I]